MNVMHAYKEGFHLFGQCIATLVNSALLLVVYVLGVGIPSLIARLFNKQFLKLKPKVSTTSYWEELNLQKKPIEEYYRQF